MVATSHEFPAAQDDDDGIEMSRASGACFMMIVAAAREKSEHVAEPFHHYKSFGLSTQAVQERRARIFAV